MYLSQEKGRPTWRRQIVSWSVASLLVVAAGAVLGQQAFNSGCGERARCEVWFFAGALGFIGIFYGVQLRLCRLVGSLAFLPSSTRARLQRDTLVLGPLGSLLLLLDLRRMDQLSSAFSASEEAECQQARETDPLSGVRN